MMTGDDDGRRRRAAEYGAAEFHTKPADASGQLLHRAVMGFA